MPYKKSKETDSEIAKKHYEWYEQNRDDTREWREGRDKCDKAYFGNQWESSVSAKLKERGQSDVVMNILRTLIRNRVSTMIANKPQGKILGVRKESMMAAQDLQDFLDWHWYNSTGQLVAERIVMGQQRLGVGYFIIHLDPKRDYGRGELMISDVSYRNVYVPKATREWDLQDAPYVQVTKLITEEDFILKYPEEEVTADYFQMDDEIRWSGFREKREKDQLDLPDELQEQNFIREIDTYERFYSDMQVLYYVPTQTAEVLEEGYELNDNEKELIKQGILKITTSPVPRVRLTKTFGEKIFKYSEILPIDYYPIIPVPDEDTGNCMPLGEIDQMFGVQELANKAWSLVIHNAALESNPRRFVDAARAGITDMKKFRDELAPPGAVVNLTLDPQTGKFPIEREQPQPLNQAFYTIFERLASHIQFGMATFANKLGDTSNSPSTYSATLQYGEWQQDNLRIPLSRLEIAIQRVFDIILQWAPKHYTFFKMFDIMKENEEPAQGSINEPVYNELGELVKTLNDIGKIRAKFRIRLGSTMPSQSVAYLNLYEKLAAVNPVFMKYMIEYLPIREKEKLVKELDMVAQLQGQNKKLQEDLNQISGMLQNSLRQQAESEIRRDVQQTALKLDTILAEQEIITKEMKSAQKQQSTNLIKQQKETKK